MTRSERVMGWSWDEIVSVASAGLERAAGAVDLEQGVRGIDALDETEVHPILAEAFAGAGFGVLREWPLPGPLARRPRRSERERCDLVLTAHAGDALEDPLAREVERERLEATLFQGALPPSVRAVAPEDAAWLELKVVGQYAYASGVPGPRRGYSAELTGALRRDLAKLASEERVRFGAALLVLFTEAPEVAEHDVPVALHRCLDAGLSIGEVRSAGFRVTERIGNAWCGVWVVPVR